MIIITGITAAWREVKAIVIGLISLILVGLLSRQRWLVALATTLLSGVFYFFRDPERTPPFSPPESGGDRGGYNDYLLSPADGRITSIQTVTEPHFMGGECQRITIFLSLFDVHVQRAPYQGVVKLLRYQSGSFAPAFLSQADDNEANLIGIETPRGPLAVKQMTGILARRIVCWVEPEQPVTLGQHLGLIKFGSRVDLFLPLTSHINVQIGQQVHGGQTIMARW